MGTKFVPCKCTGMVKVVTHTSGSSFEASVYLASYPSVSKKETPGIHCLRMRVIITITQ